MHATVRRAAPNSLVLVVSSERPEVPESLAGRAVVATATCIAIGTVAEDDGTVEVTLTDSVLGNGAGVMAGEFFLSGDSPWLSIEDVYGETWARCEIERGRHFVRVWLSDLIEPERVTVEIVDRGTISG